MNTSPLLLLASCLFLLTASFAQNGYQLRMGSGYNLYYQPYFGKKFTRFPNQVFTVTQHVECHYFKNTQRNGRLFAGLGYERSSYVYKNFMSMQLTDAMAIAPFEELISFKSVNHSLYVPVAYQHFLGKKKNLVIGAGLAQQFALLIHSKSTFKQINGVETRTGQSTEFFFDSQSCLQLETGCRFRIKEHYELMALAYLKAQGNVFDLKFRGYNLQPGLTVGFSILNKTE